jgi:hypothetical protein
MTEGSGGSIPLRPLSLGEIFNGAVASMRRGPAASLGIAALLSVVAGAAPALATLNVDRLRLAVHCDVSVRREGLDLVLRTAADQQGASDAGLLWAPLASNGQRGQPAW